MDLELDVQKQKKGHLFVAGLLTGVLATSLIVVIGFFMGRAIATSNTPGTPQAEIEVGGSGTVIANHDDIINDEFLDKVELLEDFVEQRYYLDEVDTDALREGAYEGIVNALGDPYSVYYTPEEAKELFEESTGVYYGIGAYVELDDVTNYVKVTGLIKGAPAEEAGLLSGDIFYKVDGEDMAGLDASQVVKHIKGEEGTVVHLTMVRDGQELEFDLVRRKVESPSVEHEMFENGMGYIQIFEFDEITSEQFRTALQDLESQDMQGLIMDLRANPGGDLYAAVDIADMLLGEGLVVYTEDKYGRREEYTSDAAHELDVPIVVLVDMNSASASEVLSGALRDHGKATLVGTTTFGKGIVQSLRGLRDGSAIKLTVSAYYTPNGTNIHGIGIEPDVEVPFDGEAYREGYDNQLEKAKEVLSDRLK